MDLSAIALGGLESAQAQLEGAAASIASAATLSPDTASVDSVSLSADVLTLLAAKDQFSLNVATLKIANETQKSIIDLIG
jgi:hypothetical protein